MPAAIFTVCLLVAVPAFVIAAIATAEWRLLLGAGVCCLLLRGKLT